MAYTITYSKKVKGFPSFYSYYPEMMVGMNNHFFSFKNGNLYRHNADNRLVFYNQSVTASIKGVLNLAPTEQKTFKTISLNSTRPWGAYLETNLSTGYVSQDWFTEKEGKQHAYIRNAGSQLDKRSIIGVGSSVAVELFDPNGTYLVTFDFDIGSAVSSGDEVYTLVGASEVINGYVIDRGYNTLLIEAFKEGLGTFPAPIASNYMYVKKNSLAESYGLTGYYMSYELATNDTAFSELFGVDSNVFKSYA